MIARAMPRPRVELEPLRRSLVAGESFAAPAWLADAALDPDAFWRGVAPALVAAGGSSRSTLFERYQLAHDLGARHATGRALGFAGYDPAGGATATSYASLVDGARALAGAWRARGVGPGACIAIVAPLSGELVTALLAAWHLGAVPAPLPVWGRTYVHDRLATAKADFVATSRPRGLWLDIPAELRLATVAAGDAAPGLAYAYAPDDPALRVFSPLGDAPLAPVDVPAERLYLGALRDAALFFDLGAGIAVAAPGFCEVQFGLPLAITCRAGGACFWAIDLDEACQRPELVCDGRIHVLGVHPQLRDAIVAGDVGGAGPPRWFRSPATPHDPDGWSRLSAARTFARSLGACYFASPVAGGAITWSAWRRSPALNTALPAPGLDWQLRDPGRGGAVASDGNGVLTSKAAPADAIGQPLLGQLAGDRRQPSAGGGAPDGSAGGAGVLPRGIESLWVTSIGAHRDGQRLPAAEIEALVAARPEVWGSALVDDPRAGAVLVVFARPDRLDAGQPARDTLAGELAALISIELAPHLVPARIEVFTLSPRVGKDGALDRDWCRGQHVSGRLAAKQREPLFTQIATLRLALEP
ncbi:MAG: hypothetical protein E6J90_30280 [Deltaproteobacteria bacterium]|nr:MAG: hypothetical protein E6J90_30280 [Deltaproteobacteria bacterium]